MPSSADEVLDRLAGEHPLTRLDAEARLDSALAYWLLMIRAKLSYRWSTFWGSGQDLHLHQGP